MKIIKMAKLMLIAATISVFTGCGSDSKTIDPITHAAMANATTDCEYDVVTFTIAGGQPQEVHLNGLPVAELPGADKVSGNTWEVVTRRGVRFSNILAKAQITADDAQPVNCVGRDNYNVLLKNLNGDTTKLPTFAVIRDHAYVYVGNPGDGDPIYPQMEGKGLVVDYDFDADDKVPAYLGGKLSSLGKFRWKMIEKVDDQQRGIIEIDPVVTP